MEAHLLLILIAQRYRLRHVPGHAVENHASITLRPRHGMLMTIHPRDARRQGQRDREGAGSDGCDTDFA